MKTTATRPSTTPRPDASAEASYPPFATLLPPWPIVHGRYCAQFATSPQQLDEVLRLRFEVFNLELNEGLASSYALGRDRDEFDHGCHHLFVANAGSQDVIGTYRVQTAEMARANGGFYSATEFDLSGFPVEIVANAVELGRAWRAIPLQLAVEHADESARQPGIIPTSASRCSHTACPRVRHLVGRLAHRQRRVRRVPAEQGAIRAAAPAVHTLGSWWSQRGRHPRDCTRLGEGGPS